MSTRTALLASSLIILTGCNPDINHVKEGRLRFDESYTIDQAFSNRDICDRVTWTTIKDSRNRDLVQYRCTIKGVSEHFIQEKESNKEKIINDAELRKRYLDRDEQRKKETYLEAKAERENHNTSIQEQLNEDDEISTLKFILEQLSKDEIREISILPENIRETMNSHTRQPWLIKLNSSYGDAISNINDIVGAIHRQNNPEAIDPIMLKFYDFNEIYEGQNIDFLKQTYREYTAKLSIDLQKNLDVAVKSELNYLSNVSELRENQEKDALDSYNLAKAEKEEKSNMLDKELPLKITALEQQPIITEAVEIFEWVVKENEIETVNRRIEYTDSAKNVTSFNLDIIDGLRRVYANRAKKFTDLPYSHRPH